MSGFVKWVGHGVLGATLILIGGGGVGAQDVPATQTDAYTVVRDVAYYPEERRGDEYQRNQCRLDLYLPKKTVNVESIESVDNANVADDAGSVGNADDADGADIANNADIANDANSENDAKDAENGEKGRFATIVWFHGGGLTGGQRYLPEALRTKALEQGGIAVVAVGYRLSPQAQLPSFIEDAAAAAVWVKRHIREYGGDPDCVFLCGGSAGGYLTAMVGMDPRWLEPYGCTPRDFAGLIPVSAQVTTHFHVKELRGIPGDQYQPVIDEYAPLAHLAADLPPILLVLGDRRIEWKARVEENELLAASLRAMGHPDVTFREFPGFDHGISAMAKDCEPDVTAAIVAFVKGHTHSR